MDPRRVTERLAAPVPGSADPLPDRPDLPRYLAPLPDWLEDFGLRIAWLVVAINLVGTAFGFWYYRHQFGVESPLIWPLVPDSPLATLFIAASLAAYKLDLDVEWLHALAFFGCIKLGAWTPYVLLAFRDGFAPLPVAMYNFLFWSHLAMVAEAFLIYRYAGFTVRGVAVAVTWYGLNDVVDYFVPIVGSPHHTIIPGQRFVDGTITHVAGSHEVAAAGAVILTLLATFLALSTRVKTLEANAETS